MKTLTLSAQQIKLLDSVISEQIAALCKTADRFAMKPELASTFCALVADIDALEDVRVQLRVVPA